MNFAQLFVNVGVKGAEGAVKALGGVNKGLGDIASSSLAAKAAVAAVIVGLERLTGFASQVGMDLHKFNVMTGLSTDELQKLQYAFMKVDVSGNEVAGALESIQAAMTDMQLGKGAPEGFATMMDAVQLDPKRINDTFYVLRKVEEFVKKAPPSVGNQLAKSMGLTDNMIQGLRTVNRERDKLAKSQLINQDEIDKLVKINSAWKDFWFTLKTMGIKFVAAEGMGAIKELGDAFSVIISAAQWVKNLADQFVAVKVAILAIGAVIAYAFAPITTVVAGILGMLAELKHLSEGSAMFGGLLSADKVKGFKDWVSKPMDWFMDRRDQQAMDNKLNQSAYTAGDTVSTVNHFHIDGSQSPEATASAVKTEVNRVARQRAAQAGSY